MDAGFYSADYLRAWIRSAQVRAYFVREVGEDWWRSERTGEILRGFFARGHAPARARRSPAGSASRRSTRRRSSPS